MPYCQKRSYGAAPRDPLTIPVPLSPSRLAAIYFGPFRLPHTAIYPSPGLTRRHDRTACNHLVVPVHEFRVSNIWHVTQRFTTKESALPEFATLRTQAVSLCTRPPSDLLAYENRPITYGVLGASKNTLIRSRRRPVVAMP